MPVELFDLKLPTERRVESLGRTLNMLAKTVVSGWPSGWKVGVINVGATDLVEEHPGHGIQGFIERSRKEGQIDWEFIRALPEDIQNEVIRQYGLSHDKLEEETPAQSEEGFAIEVDQETTDDQWDDDGDTEMEDTKETCTICKVKIFSWMTEAHARYHELSA
jgi:hypothetical protein